jgi:amidase
MLDATARPGVGAPYYTPAPSRPFLDAVGKDPGRLRIAFTSQPFLPGTVHADCIKGLEATVKLCQDLGHEMVETAPQIDGKAFARAFLMVACGETRADIEEAEVHFGSRATSRDFEPETWAVGLLGRQITAAEFSKATRLFQRSARQVGRFFEEYDVLLTPTLAMPPVVTGALQSQGVEAFALKLLGSLNAGGMINALAGIDALAERTFEFMPYTPLFNATGQPAMSVPLYWNDERLPIGMHFAGRFGDEATLFRLAGQLEQAKPWFDCTPPICD